MTDMDSGDYTIFQTFSQIVIFFPFDQGYSKWAEENLFLKEASYHSRIDSSSIDTFF